MRKYIDKSALAAEIKKRINEEIQRCAVDLGYSQGCVDSMRNILSFLNTLEVIDPYEQCIQYDSIKTGIKAHAETYSFNIESKLFNQLTKEQQELWREEIEQACISGGEVGVELARDPRYKENLEMEENNLVEEIDYEDYARFFKEHPDYNDGSWGFEEAWTFAQYFYTLGLKAQKGE